MAEQEAISVTDKELRIPINPEQPSPTDLVSPQWNKQAGLVKDVAAGAVLMVCLVVAIIGIVIFSPYLLKFIR